MGIWTNLKWIHDAHNRLKPLICSLFLFWVLVVLFSFRCNGQGHFNKTNGWSFDFFFFLGINLMKGVLVAVSAYSISSCVFSINAFLVDRKIIRWHSMTQIESSPWHPCRSCWPILHTDAVSTNTLGAYWHLQPTSSNPSVFCIGEIKWSSLPRDLLKSTKWCKFKSKLRICIS